MAARPADSTSPTPALERRPAPAPDLPPSRAPPARSPGSMKRKPMSAEAVPGTTFVRPPPVMVPTLHSTSSKDPATSARTAINWSTSSSIAETPDSGSSAACASRPVTSIRTRLLPRRASSGRRSGAAVRARSAATTPSDSAVTSSRAEGEPTSSSATTTIRTGRWSASRSATSSQRGLQDDQAALHVEDARPVDDAVLLAPGHRALAAGRPATPCRGAPGRAAAAARPRTPAGEVGDDVVACRRRHARAVPPSSAYRARRRSANAFSASAVTGRGLVRDVLARRRSVIMDSERIIIRVID